MGTALIALVQQTPDLALAAQIVRLGQLQGTTLDCLTHADFDVLIDFSHRETVTSHADWVAKQRVAWVLGTTGLTAADVQAVAEAAQRTIVFEASNFSIGVALLLSMVAKAAQTLGLAADIEIVEAHHHFKQDAPSGTALALAQAAAEARGQTLADVRRDGRSGLIGARTQGEIGIHALRMGSIVGEHDVHFAWEDELLTLSHKAKDRRVFAHGALKAARFCAQLQRQGSRAGLFGMADLLTNS